MKRDPFDPMRPVPDYLDVARTPENSARRNTRLAFIVVAGAAVVLVIWFVVVGGAR